MSNHHPQSENMISSLFGIANVLRDDWSC